MSRTTNLHDLLAALAGQSEAQTKMDNAFQTMRERGVSDDNIRTFALLHKQVPNLAETLALSATLNHFTSNLPACTFGLATVTFLRGATQWMYDLLDRCHIAPDTFDMQDSPNNFFKFLGEEQDKFNKTLAQHAEDEALLKQLHEVSRAACE